MVEIAALLGTVLIAGAPYEDPQGRFTLQVPDAWTIAPLPGDLSGTAFSRDLDGIPASASVRCWPMQQGASLRTLVRAAGAAVSAEPGYRLLREQSVSFGGAAGVRRRFVLFIDGDPKWTKMVEQYAGVFGTRGCVVHVETIAEAFGVFERDFEEIFSSFKPWVDPILPLERPPAGGENGSGEGRVSPLVGVWSGTGMRVEFSPSGVVLIDDRDNGRYKVEGGVIVMRFGSKTSVVTYERKADTLRLKGGRFGEGTRLHRIRPPRQNPNSAGSRTTR